MSNILALTLALASAGVVRAEWKWRNSSLNLAVEDADFAQYDYQKRVYGGAMDDTLFVVGYGVSIHADISVAMRIMWQHFLDRISYNLSQLTGV